MAKNKNTSNSVDEVIIEEVKASNPSFMDFLNNNQRNLLLALGAVLLIIAAYFAYKYLYLAPREKEAMNQLYRAELQFQKDSFQMALQSPGGGFEGFIGIADNYSGTKAANLAKYYAGICYLNLGKFDDAINYLSSHTENGVTAITKYGAMGDAYAELGKFDDALSSYHKAIREKNSLLTPYYLNKLGILAQTQGKADDAKKAFEIIRDEYPQSSEAIDAAKYLAMLQ